MGIPVFNPVSGCAKEGSVTRVFPCATVDYVFIIIQQKTGHEIVVLGAVSNDYKSYLTQSLPVLRWLRKCFRQRQGGDDEPLCRVPGMISVGVGMRGARSCRREKERRSNGR